MSFFPFPLAAPTGATPSLFALEIRPSPSPGAGADPVPSPDPCAVPSPFSHWFSAALSLCGSRSATRTDHAV